MVAITHREADKFIAGGSSQFHVYLVFGPDAGLVSERSAAVLRRTGFDPSSPDQVMRLEGDAIAGDPGILFDEAHSTGLFAEKRSIIIRNGGKQITSAIETALANPADGCVILIQAAVLRKDAPLRALVTRAKNGAAIECYPDQAKDIERLIDAELQAAGVTIEPEARRALSSLLGDDRLSTRAELEKLILYSYKTKRISEADVINAVADASAFALENLVFSGFSGKLTVLVGDSAPIYGLGGEAAALMAMTQRHVHMLHSIRNAIDAGSQAEAAIDRFGGRNIFGARRDMLNEQVRLWQRPMLAQLIEDSNRTTLESRVESSLAPAIVIEFLMTIGRRFQALSRRRG